MRSFLWLLWLAVVSFVGGFVGWLVAVVALNLAYSTGPPPRLWIIHGSLVLGIALGAIAGSIAAYTQVLPRRFSLRTLLIAVTMLCIGLGTVVYLSG